MCLGQKTSSKMGLEDELLQDLMKVVRKEAVFPTIKNFRSLTPEEHERLADVRAACVHYIRCPHVTFATQPETFALALTLLDLVLLKLKVTTRLMSIVGVACYVIAAKLAEEDEHTPSHEALARLPGHAWTARDLGRMELLILDKIAWQPCRVTYLSYLPPLCRLLLPPPPAPRGPPLTELAERCLRRHATQALPPSALALGLVLRLAGYPEDEASQQTVHRVMQACQVDEYQLALVRQELATLSSPTKAKAFPGRKVFTKPSEVGSPDLATIHEFEE